MGKVIGTVLKIGGIAALGILTAGSAFLLAAGAGLGFVSATFGTAFLIAGAAVNIGKSLTASAPSGADMEDPGLRLNLTTDPAKPREICYGMAATGGTLVFRDTVGSNNSDLWMVTVLAGHEIESLEEVKFGGVTTTFSNNEAVGQFAGKWFQYVFLGTDSQTANTNLVAASTKWTTNHRLRGVAYVVNRFIYDQDVFPKGLEQVVYTFKAKKVYDPRLDGTQGGSGSHRFADKSTWEWSENPALCEIDYLRGETQNTRLIWGMGQAETAFDWPNMISEANICEEQITLKAGGTEDRYTCNGFLNTANKHDTNIRAILSSCAGNLVWQSGVWRIYVGAARTATKTRVENQFIGPVKYVPYKEYLVRANAIRGLYNDPEAGYQAKDYPLVINSTFVTEDGGQELWGDLNLPMTKSKSTAQRLANIALKSSRMEKVFTATLNTIGFEDQAQDSVNLTYSRFNLSSQKMIITDWALRFQADTEGKIGLVVEETFVETDDDIYAWTAATDEATIPAVIDLLNPDPVLLNWGDVDDDGNKPEDGATLGADWDTTLTTRPTELTDGRVSAGLNGSGALNQDILSSRLDSSNVLRFTSGGLYSGDLTATLGADWDTTLTTRPGELTDGRVSAGLDGSGDLNRNVTVARTNSSDILRRTTGGLYAGELDATLGADWDTTLTTRPTELTDGRVSAGLNSDGDLFRDLHPGILADQGDGVGRRLMIGFETGEARDSDAITFSTAYSDIPTVQWLPSGITTESTLTGDVSVSYEAIDITTTGFTASILLKELAAIIVSHTDTLGVTTGGGGEPDIVMDKVDTTPNAAWDDKYKFQFDVTIRNLQRTFAPDPITYSAGTATFGIYIKTTSGGSFVKFGSITVTGAAGSNQNTTVNNVIKTVTVSGVVDFSGKQFGVNLESSTPSGSIVFDIDSVKYETATPPDEADASPSGASPSRFMVIQ